MVFPSDNPKNAFHQAGIQKKIDPPLLLRQTSGQHSSINSAQQKTAPFTHDIYFGEICGNGGW